MEENYSNKSKNLIDFPDNKGEKSAEQLLQEKFDKERKEINGRITELSKQIKNVNGLENLQVDVYSYRQQLVEKYHYLISILSRVNMAVRKKKKKKLLFYDNNYQIKLDKKDRLDFIMIDLEKEYIKKQEIENHIKFISESMKTVDNIIFGIKHRISIEEYKRIT